MSIFLFYCMILSAFILGESAELAEPPTGTDAIQSPPCCPRLDDHAGTVTLLMVKGDKRSKVFRDRILALREFSLSNGLPEVLYLAQPLDLKLQSCIYKSVPCVTFYPSSP